MTMQPSQGTTVVTSNAALLQIRGDWEALAFAFRLRWFKSERFCWMCDCTQSPGPMCYHNLNTDDPHPLAER